ncbi:hypothetical protein [Corallococcus llansteffanensis]|uniref:Uncharacterized protein n=1 Tax=Corallococcus llansteffanensis TaxID=2316731 RepID=A0A3A8QIW6_9BACT|nr:hypothetical protein [Corallococcus llansteffanensis]RKH68646.1 hypothetical protein D7V93_01005 [Corallococcus llansteffanensis]
MRMDNVQRLVARRVEKLLEQLALLVARGRTGEDLPAIGVTLHLAHGHQVSGELLDYLPKEAVLLALKKEALSRSESVTYVDLASVVAVTVTDAGRLAQVPGMVRPLPTRSDLQKLAEQLAKGITEQFWPSEGTLGGQVLRFEVDWVGLDDEPGRLALELALNVASHALKELGRSEKNGREAIRAISTVRFVKGKETVASLEGDTGTVTVGPGGTPTVQAFRKGFTAGR